MLGRLPYRVSHYATTVSAWFLPLGRVIVPDDNKTQGTRRVLEFDERILVPHKLLDDPNKFPWAFQVRQMS